MATQASLEGDERLIRTLDQAGEDLEDLTGLHQDLGNTLAERASSNAPVREGALAASIRGWGDKETFGAEVGVPYGGVQEWGWRARNIPAQPYLGPAYKATLPEIESRMAKHVEQVVGKVRGV